MKKFLTNSGAVILSVLLFLGFSFSSASNLALAAPGADSTESLPSDHSVSLDDDLFDSSEEEASPRAKSAGDSPITKPAESLTKSKTPPEAKDWANLVVTPKELSEDEESSSDFESQYYVLLQEDIDYSLTDEGIIISLKTSSEICPIIVIPENIGIDGTTCKIVGIDAYAFANCDWLKEIYIPTTVKHIGYGAFLDCLNLKRVCVLGDLVSIEMLAFCNCKNLEMVFLEGSVQMISKCAFEDCNKIETFYYNGEKQPTVIGRLVDINNFTVSVGNEYKANSFAGCAVERCNIHGFLDDDDSAESLEDSHVSDVEE